ncbi:MAG: hypothetical protein ACKVT2_02425, partial [Saprospiraceae bacterium]
LQSNNASGITIRNSGVGVWGRTSGFNNSAGLVGDCTDPSTGFGVRAAHASGTSALLATPNESGHFFGPVAVDGGFTVQDNNSSFHVHNDGPNANVGVEIRSNGGFPLIDFSGDLTTDYDARFILQGDKKLAYHSSGGHAFYAGNGRLQVVGNGQQSGIDLVAPAGWGFMGFNGSGSMQLTAPGHMDYISQGGGNHNFYGGRIVANDNNATGPNVDVHNYANIAIRGETSNADAILGVTTGDQIWAAVAGHCNSPNGNALWGGNFATGRFGLIGGKDYAAHFWGGGVRIDGAASQTVNDLAYYAFQFIPGIPPFIPDQYLANTGGLHGPFTENYSLYANGRIAATEFNAFSDRRIKDISGISNSRSDLHILNQIQVTDYFFKDRLAQGTRPQKKVIGQQVAQVYPQAVNTHNKEIVPDIMQMAKVAQGWINLPSHTLHTSEKVRLIFEHGKEELEVIESTTEGFRVATDKTGDVFVYGREVNDFHIVDYEAIAMLNVSATQELTKQVTDLKKQLEARDAQINAALHLLQTLQQDVADLKAARTEQVEPRTVEK